MRQQSRRNRKKNAAAHKTTRTRFGAMACAACPRQDSLDTQKQSNWRVVDATPRVLWRTRAVTPRAAGARAGARAHRRTAPRWVARDGAREAAQRPRMRCRISDARGQPKRAPAPLRRVCKSPAPLRTRQRAASRSVDKAECPEAMRPVRRIAHYTRCPTPAVCSATDSHLPRTAPFDRAWRTAYRTAKPCVSECKKKCERGSSAVHSQVGRKTRTGRYDGEQIGSAQPKKKVASTHL